MELKERWRDVLRNAKPSISISTLDKIGGIWSLCVAVMNALEVADGGDRKRANQFFCRLMSEKDGPGLTALVEETVDVR